MDQEVLNAILADHVLWLEDNNRGKKADLRGADLHRANLHRADLYGADLYGANLHRADLYGANLREADLSGADLRGADLHRANLHRADLYGADLDFSCLPLWCGSFDVKVSFDFVQQLLYHVCRLDCDDGRMEAVRNNIRHWANDAPVRARRGLPEIKKEEAV